ncbi:MAG: YqhA family protein [Hyphomicrobiales bacterium]|nr:YqhA family protein [Hyphomicrobiales bacterium]
MIKDAFERLLFASRFLLTPLYLILAVCLFALIGKTGLHLYDLFSKLASLDDEQVMLSVLGIVDMTLSASLVVICFLSGYSNFVAPVQMRPNDGRPHWIAEIGFVEFKLNLMASIVAISAIKLLESFMEIEHESDRDLAWATGIHLTFVISTILFALADRFGHHRSHGGVADV